MGINLVATGVKSAPPPSFRRPIRWASPSPDELARYVREKLEEDPENLTYTTHAARDRLRQRGFEHEDILRALTNGYAYRMDKGVRPNEFKVNFSRANGTRDMAVAILLSPETSTITVVTVMWVDKGYAKPC